METKRTKIREDLAVNQVMPDVVIRKNIGKPKMVEWVDRYGLDEWCVIDW